MGTIIKSARIADESVMVWPLPSEKPAGQTDIKARVGISNKNDVPDPSEIPLQNDGRVNELPRNETVAILDAESPEFSHESFLENNQEKLLELEEQAMKDGYAQGYLKGEADARKNYLEAISLLQQLADSGHKSALSVLKEAEELVGAIVFEAVCKIVGEQLVSIEGCREVISQVIKNAQHDEIVSITVSPKDFERLKRQDNDQGQGLITEALSRLSLEADASVELGGCLLKLKDGRIDGRIETQFRLFAQSIKEAVNRN